jgi:hypothetical protein
MPALMPERRLKDMSGPKTVGENPVGGSAFTKWVNIEVTPEREAWVELKAKVKPANEGLFLVHIDRTEAGYRLVIPAVEHRSIGTKIYGYYGRTPYWEHPNTTSPMEDALGPLRRTAKTR